MAKLTPTVILLRGDPLYSEAAQAAGAAIIPGMLLSRASAGTFIKHAVAGGAAEHIVAREMDFAGRSIDAVYADGERVMAMHLRKGDWAYMFLETAANVAIGAFLASNGAGALEPVGAGVPLFVALEAVNNASGANVRIKVEAI